jgi:hypothetical protein
MLQTWHWTWAAAAFVSEIAALVALGVWGFTASGPTALRVVLGLGAPLAAAVLWGLFAAPQAAFDVPVLAVVVKLGVFGAAVAALLAVGSPRLAVTLAAVAFLGAVLSDPAALTAPAAGISAPHR